MASITNGLYGMEKSKGGERSVENEEYGKCAVLKMESVENEKYNDGKYGK